MSETLLEKHQAVVVEMAQAYLDNMELELAKKYNNNAHQVSTGIPDASYDALKGKYAIPSQEFADLYQEFLKMKPSKHLAMVMSAFTASGGSVDVEPAYDEAQQRLKVSLSFIIGDKTLDKIEGLSPIEDLLLKRDAMLQIDNVLSGADSDIALSL